jgi:hypothetical protein
MTQAEEKEALAEMSTRKLASHSRIEAPNRPVVPSLSAQPYVPPNFMQ